MFEKSGYSFLCKFSFMNGLAKDLWGVLLLQTKHRAILIFPLVIHCHIQRKIHLSNISAPLFNSSSDCSSICSRIRRGGKKNTLLQWGEPLCLTVFKNSSTVTMHRLIFLLKLLIILYFLSIVIYYRHLFSIPSRYD